MNNEIYGSFDVFVPPYTDTQNLALQLIDGKWDDVLTHLLGSAGENAVQDGSFKNGQILRQSLLGEEGPNAFDVLEDVLKTHTQTELKQIGGRNFLADLQAASLKGKEILEEQNKLQKKARDSAEASQVERMICSAAGRRRVENDRERLDREFKNKVSAWEEEARKLQAAQDTAARELDIQNLETDKTEALVTKLRDAEKALQKFQYENPEPSRNVHDTSNIINVVRSEAQAAIEQNPPSISLDAWKEQEKTEEFTINSEGKKILGGNNNQKDLHTIYTRDLQPNGIQLSENLQEKLLKTREISSLTQEKGKNNLAEDTIKEVLGVIIDASEYLSIDNQWNAIGKTKIPLEAIAPILIEKQQVGLTAWLMESDIGYALSEEDTVKAMRLMKTKNHKSAPKTIYKVLSDSLARFSDDSIENLIGFLSSYNGGDTKIQAFLEDNIDSLSPSICVAMVQSSFRNTPNTQHFQKGGIIEKVTIKVMNVQNGGENQDQEDLQSRYSETVLSFINEIVTQSPSEEVLHFLQRNTLLVQTLGKNSTVKKDLLASIQAHMFEQALSLGIIKEKTKRGLTSLGMAKKTGFLEWNL